MLDHPVHQFLQHRRVQLAFRAEGVASGTYTPVKITLAMIDCS